MWKNKFGFSLVELLVVISVIGVLAATVIPISVRTNINRGNDNRRKADLESLRSALELSRSDLHTYPCSGTDLRTSLEPNYLKSIPADPKTGTYNYVYTGRPIPCPSTINQYCVGAYMEIASNANTIPSTCAPLDCGDANCNYYVTEP